MTHMRTDSFYENAVPHADLLTPPQGESGAFRGDSMCELLAWSMNVRPTSHLLLEPSET